MKKSILDSESWRIELLANYGFSYKCIAARIFYDGKLNKVTEQDTRRVGQVLRKADIRVWDYRHGISDLAQGVLKGCLREKRGKVA